MQLLVYEYNSLLQLFVAEFESLRSQQKNSSARISHVNNEKNLVFAKCYRQAIAADLRQPWSHLLLQQGS